MTRLPVTLACGEYDRTRDIADGRVPVEGVDLNYLTLPAEEIFHRMLAHGEFDVAEMSLSSYVLTLSADAPPFIAIPVFPSRAFRHSAVWVRADSPIEDPADLRDLVVGIPEYQITAAVWIRGIFAELHGLPVAAPRYRTGGLRQPGRREKLPLDLPPEVVVDPIGPTQTLTQLLQEGDIDALYTARAPVAGGGAAIRPLFRDPQGVERQYFRRSGIFPIMHTVVLRRDLYERNRWLARSLQAAFTNARNAAYRRLADTTASTSSLPWQVAGYDDARALMGADYWPYGVAANDATLRTFLRYSHEQGLAKRLLEPDQLFAPETLTDHAV